MNARTLLSCLAVSIEVGATAGLIAQGTGQTRALGVAVPAYGFQYVDTKGNIRKPDRDAQDFPPLGAVWVDSGVGGELHLVWASPGTAAAYRLNNAFADGDVLVQEVVRGEHGRLTNGVAHFDSVADTKAWYVMIKDAEGRYPGNRLWGDGWGWALFDADAPEKQVAVDYKRECLDCMLRCRCGGDSATVQRRRNDSADSQVSDAVLYSGRARSDRHDDSRDARVRPRGDRSQ
jgi:Cytochrome P460